MSTKLIDEIRRRFAALRCKGDFWSLRYVDENATAYSVRKNVPQPPQRRTDRGVMLTVHAEGGCGYAATGDLSLAGLQQALDRALHWACAAAPCSVFDFRRAPWPGARGEYMSPDLDAAGWSLHEAYERLMSESQASALDERIVDWEAAIELQRIDELQLTSAGGDIVQRYRITLPNLSVSAHANGDTQTRTLNGYRGLCQQGAEAMLEQQGFTGGGRRLAEEVLQLLAAPDCPSGVMDALLMPDQVMLQVHESVGHPLELDRILGDERNFAGTSFVTLDMFGSYRYGSDLLNIVFDPGVRHELASYGFDDEGTPAEKTYLIRNGILERPLGGAVSQARAGIAGVANARANNWNRPPIDRMANLNLEPGSSTLQDMIAGIEHGILMSTNTSWSIDDSRNKFQFGCEWGQLIQGGELRGVVKNPNYRGVSAEFWRSLREVGSAATLQVLGTPSCGKGEPAQVISVGHAAPACVFANVQVFGGDSG